jgi:hypothetical protein
MILLYTKINSHTLKKEWIHRTNYAIPSKMAIIIFPIILNRSRVQWLVLPAPAATAAATATATAAAPAAPATSEAVKTSSKTSKHNIYLHDLLYSLIYLVFLYLLYIIEKINFLRLKYATFWSNYLSTPQPGEDKSWDWSMQLFDQTIYQPPNVFEILTAIILEIILVTDFYLERNRFNLNCQRV